jgi:hypothetical protein
MSRALAAGLPNARLAISPGMLLDAIGDFLPAAVAGAK